MFKTKLSKVCATALLASCASVSAFAYSDVGIFDPNTNTQVFTMRILEAGDSYVSDDKIKKADWSFTATQRTNIETAARLYAEMLGKGSLQTSPVMVRVVGAYDPQDPTNAFAGPEGLVKYNGTDIVWPYTTAQINGVDITTDKDWKGFAAAVTINQGNSRAAEKLSQLPPDNSLLVTVYHELGHAMGILSVAGDSKGAVDNMSLFDTHLRDANGLQLAMGLKFNTTNKEDAKTKGEFYVGQGAQSGVTFHGIHVDEVTNGLGIAINGWELGDEGKSIELSHTELERSQMSHQNYRDYSNFTEAELALLQDIGYNIDRKNYYGRTIFTDGNTLTNTQGFFARSDGEYLEGVPNTATLGVGLHIYGKNNNITQAADLLADGIGGAGVRVDGSNNKLTINDGVKVTANGQNGAALLVAYGKNHQIISKGDLSATGTGGIAAQFDFGDNMLGNKTEYRGSYIRTVEGKNDKITGTDGSGFALNLDGPLVESFNVSGSLTGKAAAIYISDNAFVKNVNFLAGSSVDGDIISDWNINDKLIQYAGNREDLLTNLTFGAASNADGTADTTQGDDNFAMTLDGTIKGANSLAMSVLGGRLTITEATIVYSLSNLNNSYLALSNEGAVVTDNFTNAAGATLEVGFNSAGDVAGVSANSATLAGSYVLRPVKDYYATNSLIETAYPVETIEGVNGGFTNVSLAANSSPTLDFTLEDQDPDSPSIRVSRSSNAYSRYASNPSGEDVGSALYGVSKEAKGDMRNLFSAIDFSSSDGSQIAPALSQLSAESYDVAARSSLSHQNELNLMLARHLLSQVGGVSNSKYLNDSNSSTWQAWVSPYAYHYDRHFDNNLRSDSTRWGLLAGAETIRDNGLTLGFHFDISKNEENVKDHHHDRIKSNSGFAGVHGRFSPGSWNGGYLMGEARLGLEETNMKREVSINGYYKEPKGHYFSPTAGALIGGGWDSTSQDMIFGPVAWLEYAATKRPRVEEKEGDAVNLEVDSKNCQSLKTALGARLSLRVPNSTGVGLRLNTLAAWRHELLSGDYHSEAHFKDYGAYGFRSTTKRGPKDSVLLGFGVSLDYAKGVTVQTNFGGELSKNNNSLNAGLSIGWRF